MSQRLELKHALVLTFQLDVFTSIHSNSSHSVFVERDFNIYQINPVYQAVGLWSLRTYQPPSLRQWQSITALIYWIRVRFVA